jgi:hypothetical protein
MSDKGEYTALLDAKLNNNDSKNCANKRCEYRDITFLFQHKRCTNAAQKDGLCNFHHEKYVATDAILNQLGFKV